jgi:hypothetical protein
MKSQASGTDSRGLEKQSTVYSGQSIAEPNDELSPSDLKVDSCFCFPFSLFHFSFLTVVEPGAPAPELSARV